MLLSVIVPAFNEELCLPASLTSIRHSAGGCRRAVELIVVDNASTDATAQIAQAFGATVVNETVRSVARARNAGAACAHGDVLVFIDADTIVPPHFLERVAEAMSDAACGGGSPDVRHRVSSKLLRAYFAGWRWIGLRLGMAQGAAQFCRTSIFRALGGYDERQFMGEDVDFYWRLRRRCAKLGGHVKFIGDVTVLPSPRRFEGTPVWRTLLWTNPLLLAPFRRSRWMWNAWYVRPPR